MIDLKLIRENPQILISSLQKRNKDKDISQIINLDKEVKELLLKTESIQSERNSLAKQIGNLKREGKDASELLKQVEASKEQQVNLEKHLKIKQDELHNELLYVPNILEEEVPEGIDENSNKLIKTVFEPTIFNFKPKSHDELGENLGMMDFELAAKISGSRFVILKKDLARLERAVSNFMLDLHTQKHGFIEYNVPVLVNESALIGTSQLPKFSEDMFRTNHSDKWLISTAEIVLTNLVQDSILDSSELPLKFVARTECFRSEAGSAGRDTKGMLRQHQFAKVEMVVISDPEKSKQELENLVEYAENILKALKIPYRVMLLCGGDTGFSAAKTYDIEVFIPSQETYREISSCSVCTDFQARRMKSRFKDKNAKHTTLVHTLNGSGLAVGRTLIAILENYQQEDGSIVIPEVLIPYMGGQKVIYKAD
ncbi:serine--tRNA ligase [Rickettsiales bacterium LUAb2]